MRGGTALRGLQPALRAGLHPGDHQPALRRVDRGLRVGTAHRRAAGPSSKRRGWKCFQPRHGVTGVKNRRTSQFAVRRWFELLRPRRRTSSFPPGARKFRYSETGKPTPEMDRRHDDFGSSEELRSMLRGQSLFVHRPEELPSQKARGIAQSNVPKDFVLHSVPRGFRVLAAFSLL